MAYKIWDKVSEDFRSMNINDLYRCAAQFKKDPVAVVVVVVVTRSLPRDGGMAEDHEAPETGQLSRVWTRGRRETESRQRACDAKSP